VDGGLLGLRLLGGARRQLRGALLRERIHEGHYPAEFFAAVLNSQPMGFYSPRTLVNEARRARLSVLPPDVHLSGDGFAVEEDGRGIRVGLSYAKHLSRSATASILT
jgi:error-prone DNA polymerase